MVSLLRRLIATVVEAMALHDPARKALALTAIAVIVVTLGPPASPPLMAGLVGAALALRSPKKRAIRVFAGLAALALTWAVYPGFLLIAGACGLLGWLFFTARR